MFGTFAVHLNLLHLITITIFRVCRPTGYWSFSLCNPLHLPVRSTFSFFGTYILFRTLFLYTIFVLPVEWDQVSCSYETSSSNTHRSVVKLIDVLSFLIFIYEIRSSWKWNFDWRRSKGTETNLWLVTVTKPFLLAASSGMICATTSAF
jgi:hypothetical protein